MGSGECVIPRKRYNLAEGIVVSERIVMKENEAFYSGLGRYLCSLKPCAVPAAETLVLSQIVYVIAYRPMLLLRTMDPVRMADLAEIF